MAKSGTATEKIVDGVYLQIEWAFMSTHKVSNYSNISLKAYIVSDGTANITGAKTITASIKLGDEVIEYFYALDINVSSGEKKQIFSQNVKATHDPDGTYSKTFEANLYFINAIINGTTVHMTTASCVVELPPITPHAVLSVPGLTLGAQATLSVTNVYDSYPVAIEYGKRIGASGFETYGTVCENLTSPTDVLFTPPIDLASENVYGETVDICFLIKIHDNAGKYVLGYQQVHSAAIPASVAPTCELIISDKNGYSSKYGGYVQGESRFHIEAKPTIAYGAEITSYIITADSKQYATDKVDTDAIRGSGSLKITATITDTRGRKCTVTETVNVLAYTRPTISLLKVKRCTVGGAEKEDGEHAQVTFSAAITSLNGKNSAAYTLGHRKPNDNEYTGISLSEYNSVYTLEEIARIFAADTGSSYSIRVTATDDFHSEVRDTVVSTAFTTFHVPASGRGFSFGKVSEYNDLFDVAYLARFLGGFMNPVVNNGADFNNITTPNTYACNDAAAAGYANSPFENGTFSVEVFTAGDSDIIQRATLCAADTVNIRIRCCIGGTWGGWRAI